MINFRVEIFGEEQFNRTFLRFGELLDDLRQVWPAVVIEFRQIEREQFAGQGVGDAGKWRPLSTAYAAQKAKAYPGKTILRRTDRLYESLTSNTPDTIYRALSDSLELGTRVEYARFHQTGTRRMAQRKVVDFNEQQRTRMMKAIQRRLLSAGRQNGIPLK